MTNIIRNSQQLVDTIDARREALKRNDYRVSQESGISASTIGLIRQRGGNMNTDTMFALAKALGLTISIQTNQQAKASLHKDTPVNQQPIVMTGASGRPQPYITDIKVINLKTSWALAVKKSGSDDWVPVQVQEEVRRG